MTIYMVMQGISPMLWFVSAFVHSHLIAALYHDFIGAPWQIDGAADQFSSHAFSSFASRASDWRLRRPTHIGYSSYSALFRPPGLRVRLPLVSDTRISFRTMPLSVFSAAGVVSDIATPAERGTFFSISAVGGLVSDGSRGFFSVSLKMS